jgi:hypothetical protein
LQPPTIDPRRKRTLSHRLAFIALNPARGTRKTCVRLSCQEAWKLSRYDDSREQERIVLAVAVFIVALTHNAYAWPNPRRRFGER